MIELTLAEVAAAVGGTLTGGADPTTRITGTVEFDSRRIGPGGLFVALPGARVDGHEHAEAATTAGAAAVLAAREVGVPAVLAPPVTADGSAANAMALAADTDGSGAAVLAGLAGLARAVVDRLVAEQDLCVVGVTGSSGKTSTKDLLAAVLAPLGGEGSVVAPPGSFNNEVGHPWTALRADERTSHLVLELSARGVGHVAALCRIAPPRIGVVLNVGTAHLGEFGSREAIARGKGELVEALPAAADGGVAVLNADDPLVAAMASRTTARVVLVGLSETAEVRAVDVRLDAAALASFTLVCPTGSVPVTLAVHGEHQVGNALAAAAVALERGASLATVAAALGSARAVSERRMDVRTRPDGVTVINDSYNANPDSVRAALKALVSMSRDARGGPSRRSWAVLGTMGELGADAVREHDAIGRFVVRLQVDRLVVVGRGGDAASLAADSGEPAAVSGEPAAVSGEPAAVSGEPAAVSGEPAAVSGEPAAVSGEPIVALHRGAVMEGSWGEESVLVPDVEAALALLADELEAGDVVLVKASKSVGLWRVADGLLAGEVA